MNLFKNVFGFSKKKSFPPSVPPHDQDFMASLIVHKQVKEYLSYLQQKEHQTICIDGFFHLLPTMPDDVYMSDLFQLITNKSRLTSDQLSNFVVNQLSRAILQKDFDLCEKILRLPLKSMKIYLPTYELVKFIHTCPNSQQLIDCLSILIEKNLPHDHEYLSWILIILFEHYKLGDEIIIEHLINIKKNIDLLFTCYGNNNVTPLMLFLHLYSNPKCQILIDHYLSNINDPSVLLQRDKWDRSYLMHLLCGRCHHDLDENSLERNQCPQASAVLARFSMLYKLGNRCDTMIKKILTSDFCISLRMVLLNYLKSNSSEDIPLDDLFNCFPAKFLSIYEDDLKRLIKNRNLDSVLTSQILSQGNDNNALDYKVKFLLQQGARIQRTDTIDSAIFLLVSSTSSMTPFILLDYSYCLDISFETWLQRRNQRTNLYICCVLYYGYPSEIRQKFNEFKAYLPNKTVNAIEKLIDVKTPACLSKLCLRKLRSSLEDLGDETIEQLRDDLPTYLRKSIVSYGYDQFRVYFP